MIFPTAKLTSTGIVPAAFVRDSRGLDCVYGLSASPGAVNTTAVGGLVQ